MKTTKPKTNTPRIILYSLIAFICICSVIFSSTVKDTPLPTETPTQTLQPTNTPTPTPTVNQAGGKLTPANTPTNTPLPTATIDPQAAVKSQIVTILGTGNRDVPRIAAIEFDYGEPGAIFINWAIDDSFSIDWMNSAARRDATEMLKAIHNSGIDYIYVILSGSFSMVDKYGNTSEDNVFNLTFNKDTVEKINWDNFRSDNIDNIADEAFIYPEFRDSE